MNQVQVGLLAVLTISCMVQLAFPKPTAIQSRGSYNGGVPGPVEDTLDPKDNDVHGLEITPDVHEPHLPLNRVRRYLAQWLSAAFHYHRDNHGNRKDTGRYSHGQKPHGQVVSE